MFSSVKIYFVKLMKRFNFFPLLNFEENFDFIFLRPDFCRSEITDPVNE